MAQFCNCARFALSRPLFESGKASHKVFEVGDCVIVLDSVNAFESKLCFCESWVDSVGLDSESIGVHSVIVLDSMELDSKMALDSARLDSVNALDSTFCFFFWILVRFLGVDFWICFGLCAYFRIYFIWILIVFRICEDKLNSQSRFCNGLESKFFLDSKSYA